MQIAQANATEMMQGSSSTWAFITTFVGVDEHHETDDGKSRLRAIRKNLDCTHAFPYCSLLETSICVNAYIVKFTLFTCVIRLDCTIGFSNAAALLFSISANAVTMMQRFR